MTTERVYIDYLKDILQALEKSSQFTAGMSFEQFREDDKTTFAVIRALEIVGEATKQIPQELRERYPSSLARNGRYARQIDTSLFWGRFAGGMENDG